MYLCPVHGRKTGPLLSIESLCGSRPDFRQPRRLSLAQSEEGAAGDDNVVVDGYGARLLAGPPHWGLYAPRASLGIIGLNLVMVQRRIGGSFLKRS